LFELHSFKKDEGKGKKVRSLLGVAVGLVLKEMRKEGNGGQDFLWVQDFVRNFVPHLSRAN
jgi:hypothetical protein